MNVYTKVREEECWRITGKAPIGVRWVDVDKGNGEPTKERYRSRLVAQQYNNGHGEGLFAATPPTESLKAILSEAASGRSGHSAGVMINDVSRAYFYADATEPTYVKLCPEDTQEGEEGMCGRLNKAMYGTRTAAREWQR